jgi:hypothetical protein
MVPLSAHKFKMKGSNPAPSFVREKMAIFLENCATGSTVVQHTTHIAKIKDSNLASSTWRRQD